MYTESVGYNELRRQTSGKLPLPSEVPKLFCLCAIISHNFTIMAIIFSIICINQKQKIAAAYAAVATGAIAAAAAASGGEGDTDGGGTSPPPPPPGAERHFSTFPTFPHFYGLGPRV
jgi:hypothetical protein